MRDVRSINFHVLMCSLVPRPSHVFQRFNVSHEKSKLFRVIHCMLKNMERPGYEASDVHTVDWEFILGVIGFQRCLFCG